MGMTLRVARMYNSFERKRVSWSGVSRLGWCCLVGMVKRSAPLLIYPTFYPPLFSVSSPISLFSLQVKLAYQYDVELTYQYESSFARTA